MRKLFIIIIFIVLTTAVLTMDTYALDPAVQPLVLVLWDGMVFYMTPAEFEAEGHPKSGLYRDGELVYTTNIWEVWGTLYFSNDGMTFIIIPPGMSRITYYEQGDLRRSHDVRSLLRDADRIDREWEPGPFEFTGPRWFEEAYHDRENSSLQITTVEGDKIIFDLSTGLFSTEYGVDENDSPVLSKQTIIIIAIAGAILLVVIGIVAFRKKISRKR